MSSRPGTSEPGATERRGVTARERPSDGRPSTDELATRLGALLGARVEVQSREPLDTGTYPKEVVGIYTESPSTPSAVFVKYEDDRERGHLRDRGGVGYEARVYREILYPAGFARDLFLGAIQASKTQVWLALEHLEDGVRVMKVAGGRAMLEAAGWVGLLHRAFEGQNARSTDSSWLLRYDEDRLRSWAVGARAVLRHGSDETSAIDRLIAAFTTEGADRLGGSSTLIHGEYYPKNILWARGRIHPVDWESAAVGPGEIDLAMLTDGWPADVTDECTARYTAARWPEGVPAEFADRLHWARVCTQLRWLAEGGFDADRLDWLRELGTLERSG